MARSAGRRAQEAVRTVSGALAGASRLFRFGMPTTYWVDVTSACNLRCVMCPQSKGAVSPPRAMELGLFKKIIDEICAGHPLVKLYLSGEPLLHPDLFAMIEYAHRRGCRTMVHTNATLLTEEMSLRFIASPLDYLSFSFDGSSAAAYEALRPPAKFAAVEENIRRYLRLRSERGGAGPQVTVEIIRTDATRGSLKEFDARWKAYGCDRVHVQPFITWLNTVPDIGGRPPVGRGFRPCPALFKEACFLPDGTVVPCCMDVLGRMPLGNVTNQPFSEIWAGARYRDLRLRHVSETVEAGSVCAICPATVCRTRIERAAAVLYRWLRFGRRAAAAAGRKRGGRP